MPETRSRRFIVEGASSTARRHQGIEFMSDDLSAEFESYRQRLRTEAEKQAFDRKIKQLLQERGVDYVRGYVDGLKEIP
jgi:hypothetical protein